MDIAAALACLAQGEQPLEVVATRKAEKPRRERREEREPRATREPRREREPRRQRESRPESRDGPDKGLERFRIEVGHSHGVKPGNIVGAIANEAEIDAEYIGRIDIQEDYSTVDLPEGMPKELFRHLKSVWVSGQKLRISRCSDKPARAAGKPGAPAAPKSQADGKPGKPGKRPAK
jgi:ATP-dependent RNA helicase DeaD